MVNHWKGERHPDHHRQQVVDTYFESGLNELQALLCNENIPPLERLRSYFALRMSAFSAVHFTRGCMLGNLSLEIADHSDTLRSRLCIHFQTWSGLFEQCIAQAQENGTIKTALPARQLAEFLLNSWEGALLRMKAEKSDAPLHDFIKVVFHTILA